MKLIKAILSAVMKSIRALKHINDFYVYDLGNGDYQFRRTFLFKKILGIFPILSPKTTLGVNQFVGKNAMVVGVERVWVKKDDLKKHVGSFITDEDIYKMNVGIGDFPTKITQDGTVTSVAVLTWRTIKT